MQMSQLQPAYKLAQRFGVKAVLYGGPGMGKTPVVGTAPRPVLCAVEPGLLSMRNSSIPTWEAYTRARIEEFHRWLKESTEARNFDTVAYDSISQTAEIFLQDEQKKNKDGRAAYGKMSQAVFEMCNDLFYMPNKHVVLIAKQGTDESLNIKRPHFPGQDLNVRIPHMFDEILNLGMFQVPGIAQPQKAILCHADYQHMARDRSGRLNQVEPPDLTALFNKAMS